MGNKMHAKTSRAENVIFLVKNAQSAAIAPVRFAKSKQCQ